MISRTSFLKGIDSTIGAFICHLFTTITFHITKKTPVVPALPECIRRILLIRPGGLGDMIILLPVIRTIQKRFPDATIDLVCEKRNINVLALAGLHENAIAYDASPFHLLLKLIKTRYDVVIDTEQFHHFSSVFGIISQAPVRIGFNINPRRNPLYTHLINYDTNGFEGDQFMNLLGPLNITDIKYDITRAFSGNTPLINEPVCKDLARHADRSFILIHPGASTNYKRWDTAKFVQTAKETARIHHLDIICIGASSDTLITTAIVNGVRDNGSSAWSYAGALNLPDIVYLMKRARLFIGTDSGMSHLATATGLPTVILFGPTNHSKWSMRNAHHAVIHANVPCAPCFIFGYHKPCRTITCMNQIKVDDVLNACEAVLTKSV